MVDHGRTKLPSLMRPRMDAPHICDDLAKVAAGDAVMAIKLGARINHFGVTIDGNWHCDYRMYVAPVSWEVTLLPIALARDCAAPLDEANIGRLTRLITEMS